MPGITKTQGTTLVPLTVGGNDVFISAAQDVSTKIAATVFMHFGLVDITGPLWEGVEFRVEASAKASGDAQWYPLVTYKTFVAPPATAVVSSMVANVLHVTDASSYIVPGNIVFIRNSTLGNSEWHRVKASSVTDGTGTITLIDTPVNDMAGAIVYNEGEMYAAQIDLTAIGRIRLVIDASNSHVNVAAEAFLTTGDSVS